MTMASTSRTARTIATMVVIGVVSCVPPDSPPVDGPLKTFRKEVSTHPVWNGDTLPQPIDRSVDEKQRSVGLYLDVSYPMAGFLPIDASSNQPAVLPTIVRNTANHLTRVYESKVEWWEVGQGLKSLATSTTIDRNLFTGSESRIDLAVERILDHLLSRRSDAGVLITDLMGTGDVTGPVAIQRLLGEWMKSEDVRSGLYHMALFGIKLDYWGVRPSSCRSQSNLGCWYHEGSKRYVPLDDVAKTPIYFLFFGKSKESLLTVIKDVRGGAIQMGLNDVEHIESEILTRESMSFASNLMCVAGKEFVIFEHEDDLTDIEFEKTAESVFKQFAIFRHQDDRFTLIRSDEVSISCTLEDSEFRFLSYKATSKVEEDEEVGLSTVQRLQDETREQNIHMSINSERILSILRAKNADSASVQLVINVRMVASQDWTDWSTEVESIGRTLNLRYFVETARLKPSSHRITMPSFLKLARQ